MSPLMKVENLGAIELFKVPAGWVDGYHKQNAFGYTHLWHPEGDDQVTLSIHYHGKPLGAYDAHALASLLREPPHDLTSQEFKSLRALMRDKALPDQFEVSGAQTGLMSKKPVLLVTGRYTQQKVDTQVLYVPADAGCTVVQEVAYAARQGKFAAHLAAAEQAFSSMRLR